MVGSVTPPKSAYNLRQIRKKAPAAGLTTVYLALGSNLGDRRANLLRATDLLKPHVRVERLSSFYDNPPVGYLAQPRFLNAVVKGRTELGPRELLEFVKGIEREMGRVERFRNAPRIIDIDILLFGRVTLAQPGLTIPHPRMTERAFVLGPLAQIAPRAIHPPTHKTSRRLLAELPIEPDLVLLGKKKGPR